MNPALREGPDIARIASLMGDPARANMLAALSDGRALTAGELAHEAGVAKQTASSHLSRLCAGGLLACEAQGRHRYFRLASEDVSHALEALMGVAAARPRARTGPRDPALRHARVCYNHLAGEMGVALFDRLGRRRWLSLDGAGAGVDVTAAGRRAFTDFGVDMDALASLRRPLCRICLDWSERRHHLAGSLGEAMFRRFTQLNWARREKDTRLVRFSPAGERAFAKWLG